MRTWRVYFVTGIVVGAVLTIIGIHTESMTLRRVGVTFPAVGIGSGCVVDRDRRARRDER